MFPKRILITSNPIGHKKYFNSTFLLCYGRCIAYAYSPDDDTLKKDYGENGKKLWRLLEQIEGINFQLHPYNLEIQKTTALKWKEVEPNVIWSIKKVYGPFKIKKEKFILRLLYTIRRNLLQPLFPKLYK